MNLLDPSRRGVLGTLLLGTRVGRMGDARASIVQDAVDGGRGRLPARIGNR
jgi:hypothetical protein